MKRLIAGVVGSVVLACGPASQLGDDDPVTVQGKSFRQDGTPLRETRIALVKEPDLGELLVGFTAVASSFGVVCLAEDPPPICDSAKTGSTDASGAFAFSLFGRDTQGSLGQASPFNLSVRGPAREGAAQGASRTERFVIQDARIEPPDLTLWEPVVGVAVASNGITVSSDALPSGSTATVAFVVPGGLVWQQAYANGEAVDGRFLEDASGTVSLHASRTDTASETEFEHRYESESRAFQSTTGAPPSRGASCLATGASGTVITQSPCALTDGDFAAAWVAPADTGCVPDGNGQGCGTARANKTITVDLGEVRSTTLIIARGVGSGEVLERSVDQTNWSGVSASTGFESYLFPVDVRYLRVRSSSEQGVVPGTLRELSVW